MQLPTLVVSVFAGFFGGTKDREPLHAAARTGNVVHAHLALLRCPDAVNAQEYRTKAYFPTAVHTAAYWNNVGVLELYLARGGKVDFPGEPGESPLQYAAGRNSREAAEVLLKRGAALDIFSAVALDKWGEVQRFFHLARAFGFHKRLANSATGRGRSKDSLLNWAIRGGSRRTVELLLQNGAAVNASRNPTWAYEVPPLHAAVGAKRLDMAAMLLKAGAKIDTQDYDGRTALHRAVLYDNPAGARFLLKHGADTEIAEDFHAGRVSDVNGDPRTFFTPLHLAARCERPDLVALLLAHGANPNARAAVPRPNGIYTREDEQELATPRARAAKGVTPLAVAADIPTEWDWDDRRHKPGKLTPGRALCVLLVYQAGGR